MLATGAYGSYSGREWKKVMFPIDLSHDGETREVTAELTAINGLSAHFSEIDSLELSFPSGSRRSWRVASKWHSSQR